MGDGAFATLDILGALGQCIPVVFAYIISPSRPRKVIGAGDEAGIWGGGKGKGWTLQYVL